MIQSSLIVRFEASTQIKNFGSEDHVSFVAKHNQVAHSYVVGSDKFPPTAAKENIIWFVAALEVDMPKLAKRAI